ncbi:MAG: SLBB domain-containing protein [Bacteriovoracaceae bacterium]|nr:SLBB domain-containing protein [Bacteriovoracaceae bacterium]
MNKSHICKKLVNATLTLSFLLPFNAHSQNYFRATEDKTKYSLKGSEYISGQNYRDALMRVNLLGAVNKPGSHLVPANSELSSLLAFAGGHTEDADIESITVKRKVKDGYTVITHDLDSFLQDKDKQDLRLRPNDLIHVPQRKPFISDNGLKILTVASTVLGLIVSGLVIDDRI